jgi:CheY-like chemotaxis protein
MVRQFRPEIVLLDIGLPGMDGYQVGQAIRRSTAGSDMLLVALTGYGQEEDRRRSRDAGFDEHLVKPPSLQNIEMILTHPKLGARSDAAASS